MEEKFTKHLIENGVFDKKTEYQILSLYKQRSLGYQYNKIKFNELMTEILITIFNNLSDIQKKYMSFHLPVKFIKLSENKLFQTLYNIILKKSLKIKIILYKYLFKWYKNIKKNSSAYINNRNTFRQRKNMNLNIDDFENNKKGNIDKYIKEYYLFNNIMKDYDNRNSKKDKKERNYFTLSNEKRSRTYNNPKNEDTQRKFEKNSNLNLNYEESIPTDKNLNRIITKNLKKRRNYKKMKTYGNYFNNNTGESIINQINARVNDNTVSSLFDFKDFLMNSNNNEIRQKYNQIEQPFPEKYLKDLNIMNAYNLKTYNNISPKISQFNIRNSLNNKNLIDEDIEKNNSSFTRLAKTPKMNINRINQGYFDDSIYYSNKRNINNNYDKNSNKLNPKFNDENIKQSHSNTHFTSTYNRLFENNKARVKNQNKKRMEKEKYFNNLSNQISREKKKVNFDRINYLYKNDDRKNNMERTKSKVENEEGLTFKPMIYKSEYDKRIYSNFMERNYSNKDSKDKYLNEFNYANSLNMNIHKKMSKKQKERIIKGFIDRTNANSLITFNTKNNKELANNRDFEFKKNKDEIF